MYIMYVCAGCTAYVRTFHVDLKNEEWSQQICTTYQQPANSVHNVAHKYTAKISHCSKVHVLLSEGHNIIVH